MRRRTRPRRRPLRRIDIALVALVALVLVGTSVAVLGTTTSSQATTTRDALADVPVSPGVPTPQHWPAAVFLGDSWTAGNDMGGRGNANWSAVLAAKLQWYPTNLSYGGTGYHLGSPTQQFASPDHLQALAAAHPDVVVILNGVNDVGRLPIADWAGDAAATFDAVHTAAPQARVVVVGLIAPGPAAALAYYGAWNDALAAAARDHGATFVDAYGEDWFGGSAASFIGSDGFHPTNAGQAYLAGRVQDDLDRDGVVADLERVRT